jgi:hypothetical protein
MLWLLILASAAAADAKSPKADKKDAKGEFQDVLVLNVKLADGNFLRIRDCKVTEYKDEYIVTFPKTIKGLESRYPKEQVVEVIRHAGAVAKRVDTPPDMKAAPPDMKGDPAPANPDPPVAVKASPETKVDPDTRPTTKSPTAERTPPHPAVAADGDWWADPDTRNKVRFGALGIIVAGLFIVALAARAGR